MEAVNVQVDYRFPITRLGDFRLHLAKTWQPRPRRTDPQSQAINSVGYADGPLAWRANRGLRELEVRADWSAISRDLST